jgi:fucose permease
VPPFSLACLAYLSVALPGSVLGLLWPSMRLSFHQPVAALGVLLVFGVAASAMSSVVTGRLLSPTRMGPMLALGTVASGAALALEALAPSLGVFAGGMVAFGLGFGAIDTALNAYAARRFGARQINWMHASYGLGATLGPLLVTALLAHGLTWRGVCGAMAAAQAAVAVVFAVARRAWEEPSVAMAEPRQSPSGPPAVKARAAVVLTASAFAAVETGIESGAGIWAFVYLTTGRGLPPAAAGVAVSAYWATMFAGRAGLGPVAEHLGPARVLAGGVAGVTLGSTLLAAGGPGFLAIAGLMIIGLSAAPIFPLLTLTTAQRTGADVTALQVAASAIGGAALPAVIGLAIGAFSARAFAPALLILSLVMCGLGGALRRRW